MWPLLPTLEVTAQFGKCFAFVWAAAVEVERKSYSWT